MRRKIFLLLPVIFAVFLVAALTVLLNVNPRITRCDYSIQNTTCMDTVNDCAEICIKLSILNPSLKVYHWENFHVKTNKFSNQIISQNLCDKPYSLNRLSEEEYVLTIKLDITGMSDDDIVAFVDDFTVHTASSLKEGISIII